MEKEVKSVQSEEQDKLIKCSAEISAVLKKYDYSLGIQQTVVLKKNI